MGRDPRTQLFVPVLLAGLATVAWATGADQELRDLALAGRVEAVRNLLATAAPDLEATDARGWTALMYAVRGGHPEIVEMLLQAGADPDQTNEAGETALHLAARRGRALSAGLLLRAGANFEIQDSEGRSPLYRAVEARHAEVIEMLQGAALAEGAGALSQATMESPEGTVPPRILESTPAPYPESARDRGIEGHVVLMVLVRRDGSVGAASVTQGLEASLDESALRTVKQWKFVPAMRDGRTVDVILEVKVAFRAPDEP
jgi:TonB family protein